MEKIKTKCGCETLHKCAEDLKWNCVKEEFADPYEHYFEPEVCVESCKDSMYSITPTSSAMNEAPTCGKWLGRMKQKCQQNKDAMEMKQSGLCDDLYNINCDMETLKMIYANDTFVEEFASGNLISLNIYTNQYWIPIHHTYYVKPVKTLIVGIMINLVVFFGFSLFSFSEIFHFAFCYRGGGCFCRSLCKNVH